MWRKNILRDLMNVMEIKRETIRAYKDAAKTAEDPYWVETFNKLASYEFIRLENIELAYDKLVIDNEWLVLRDLFDETPKTMEIKDLIKEISPGKALPDHNTLEIGLKSAEKILLLYNDILLDCEHRLQYSVPLIKWLKHQAEEYVKLLKTLQKENDLD